MIPKRAMEAVYLYKNKKDTNILVTGGIGYFSHDKNSKEANKMQQFLLENGVKDTDIIIEDNSKNTYQNIKYSYNILSNIYNLEKVNILLVTSDFHMKRCVYLARIFFKSSNIYEYPVKGDNINLDNWKSTHAGRKLIIQEKLLFLISRLKK